MEPITAGAITLATILSTKALEKTGEKFGETLFNKIGKFLESLKKHSPETVTAIEKAPEQPLDYGQVVVEVETAAKAVPEIHQAMQELAAAAKAESNPKLSESIEKLANSLKSQAQSPSVINNQKLADEIKNVFQGNVINNPTFN